MNLYLPDTNIFIYAHYGQEPYVSRLSSWITEKSLLISAIVAAEFLSGGEESEREKFQALVDYLGTVPVDTAVARIAATYRRDFLKKRFRLRLPDCLIAGTAKLYGATLVSSDLKDFPMKDIEKMEL